MPPRLYGGIERVIALLVEGLVARGHAVTLFGHADSKVSADLVAYSGHRSGSAADTMMNAAQIAIEAARRHPDVIHSFGRLAYLLPVMPLPIPKIMSYQRAVTKRSVELGTRLSRGTLYFTACSRQLMRDVDGPAWQVIYNGVSTDAVPVRAGRLDRRAADVSRTRRAHQGRASGDRGRAQGRGAASSSPATSRPARNTPPTSRPRSNRTSMGAPSCTPGRSTTR